MNNVHTVNMNDVYMNNVNINTFYGLITKESIPKNLLMFYSFSLILFISYNVLYNIHKIAERAFLF